MAREESISAGRKTQALDRVTSETMALLLEKPLHEISISEIAARSHCSTATIYEIYGSKDNLFDDALAQLLLDRSPPQPVPTEAEPFRALLAYMEARIRYFCMAETRAMFQAMRQRRHRLSVLSQRLMYNRVWFTIAADLVSGAMSQGHLRETDADAVTYIIFGMAAYEPVIASDLFGSGAPVLAREMLRKSITPLATELGQSILADWISAMPQDPPAGTQLLPLSRHDQRVCDEGACVAMVRGTLKSLGISSPSVVDRSASYRQTAAA